MLELPEVPGVYLLNAFIIADKGRVVLVALQLEVVVVVLISEQRPAGSKPPEGVTVPVPCCYEFEGSCHGAKLGISCLERTVGVGTRVVSAGAVSVFSDLPILIDVFAVHIIRAGGPRKLGFEALLALAILANEPASARFNIVSRRPVVKGVVERAFLEIANAVVDALQVVGARLVELFLVLADQF